jgi:3-oxoacyl-[acyl-carrier protein] reductase
MSQPSRTALVTGAGGTVGSAIAVALASAGHPVGLTDVDPDALERTRAAVDGRSTAVVADAVQPDEVDRAVASVVGDLGPVGILVNAVGVFGPRVPFLDADPDAWWRVLEVNLRGPALFVRAVLPAMVDQGRGHVVNISSRTATWDDPQASSVAYASSKAALTRLTGALATELSGTGVVVVALSPGLVRSAMTAGRADLDVVVDEAFFPPARAADLVVDLVSGRHDGLHGRFVHVLDDLDDLGARLAGQAAARTLRLVPTDPDDPLA